jgi:hypothetical protein
MGGGGEGMEGGAEAGNLWRRCSKTIAVVDAPGRKLVREIDRRE